MGVILYLIDLSRRYVQRGLPKSQLFTLLNGDRQTLLRALKEAEDYGETLQLILKAEGPASNLPFELLYHTDFLVPSQIHLIRRVSDRGIKRQPEPANRPLKILFMACSPPDTYPVLAFGNEEDTIFEVTKELPVEIDVEDTAHWKDLASGLTRMNTMSSTSPVMRI